MRRGFSLITAIFIIVLMATVAGFVMNLSGKMVQSTTTQFFREQSALLAKSYTEYAIMAVTANDHNSTNCLNNISGTFGDDGTGNPLYTINVDIAYIARNDAISGGNCTNVLSNAVVTEESPLSIIVDVFVSYVDINHPDDQTVTYHKRTLQKI